MTADPRVPHLVSLSKRHDIVINLIRNKVSFVPSKVRRYSEFHNKGETFFNAERFYKRT
jgi:hypothetical protein